MAAKLISRNDIQRKAIEESDDDNKEGDYEGDDEEEWDEEVDVNEGDYEGDEEEWDEEVDVNEEDYEGDEVEWDKEVDVNEGDYEGDDEEEGDEEEWDKEVDVNEGDYEGDDEEEGDDDGLKEFQPLIDEVNKLQETSGMQLPCLQHPEHPEENSAANNVVEDFSKKIEALNDGSDRWCADCSKARRVEDMRSLQRGQHISIPGEHSSFYFKSLGKRISAYRHHAIVKEIVQRSRQMAEVILIHFSKEDNVIKVREQRRTFHLQHDELYMIEYQYSRYDSDTIVQRAESILEQSEKGELFKRYNPFTKNCEHFAIWCVLGEKKSLQAHTFINDIKQMLWSIFGDGNKIARLILTLFTKAIHLPSVALGLNSAAHIIYCMIKTVYLIKQYKKEKTICWHCFKEKLLDLWLQFGVFSVTSVITFVILNFALPLLGQYLSHFCLFWLLLL